MLEGFIFHFIIQYEKVQHLTLNKCDTSVSGKTPERGAAGARLPEALGGARALAGCGSPAAGAGSPRCQDKSWSFEKSFINDYCPV